MEKKLNGQFSCRVTLLLKIPTLYFTDIPTNFGTINNIEIDIWEKNSFKA